MDRQATISIALGGAAFNLERFDSVERLSEPFVITVEGFAKDEVDFLDHLGKPVMLDFGDQLEHVRYFHGRLTDAVFMRADGVGYHYRMTLRPWFHLLSHNRNYRIFQTKSVVDIAKKVFADAGMKDVDFSKLTKTYSPRDYCVQYKEGDFQFLSRLFEDEGIYYYFRHEKAAHQLVLCDAKSAHKAAPNFETVRLNLSTNSTAGTMGAFWDWTERVSTVGRASVTLRAFDFTKPQEPVTADSQAASQHPGDALEIYEYTDDFTEKSAAAARAKTRLAASRADRRMLWGVGDVPGLACGGLFTLAQAAVKRFNREYLIVSLHQSVEVEGHSSGSGGSVERVTRIEAIASDTLFRPPHVTPKPMATGIETATVTGPKDEVIYVDEHGRVKVRFHWDRSPDDPGKTSCWIRVSHHGAGEGFGNVDLPRVGQEVVVDFLNGDPDRPLITGRVYNGQRKHTYDLPEHKTRSLWRTQTVGDSGDYSGSEKPPPSGKGFNEIRFEDKGGEEEVYIHAQRKMLTEVLLDDEFKIQRDRKTRVGRDRADTIKNNESVVVEDGNQSHQVKKGDYSVKADLGSVTVEAMKSITLKVGQNTIVVDQKGVTINALTITLKGGMVEVQGSSMIKATAPMINLN